MPIFYNLKQKTTKISLQVHRSKENILSKKHKIWVVLTSALLKRKSAVITLELSLALTLFLSVTLALIYPLKLMALQAKLQAAIEQTSDEIAMGAGLGIYGEKVGVGDSILNGVYAKERVISLVGKEILDNSFIINGSEGLSFIETAIMTGKNDVDIVVRYSVDVSMPLLNLKKIMYVQRARKRLWTGKSLEDYKNVSDSEIVYVTKYGTVYHDTLACRYLTTKVYDISSADVEQARNVSGAKYYQCEVCKSDSNTNDLFITKYGTKFHQTSYCSSLIVTIHTTKLSESNHLPPCSYCVIVSN
jgi:hypothetical protein